MPKPYHELRACYRLNSESFREQAMQRFTCRAVVPPLRDVGGTISIALTRRLCSVSVVMRRVLVVILIIAAVIFLGWNKPFKDSTAQVYTNITSWFDSLAR